MRQLSRKGLITVAAAGGVLALGGGYAQADAGAYGSASNSPGVASGNAVQVPVHVPVNVCGNTVNVIALLNPTFGNGCASDSGSDDVSTGGAHTEGASSNSPGVASGNTVQVPLDVPVNVCGNTVDAGAVLNPAFGNDCGNGGGDDANTPPSVPNEPGSPQEPGTPEEPATPGEPTTPAVPGVPVTPTTPQPVTPVTPAVPNAPGTRNVDQGETPGQLAQTGSSALGLLAPAGAGLLLAGTVLYRRARASA
ncbi:chaplin family protein [Streptomyces sp. NBC_01481]|uniref:chaplin n=1 Tax=Streptomyces sp. NBC_01481 TaxID=2975869 RepID=UPI002B1CBEDF|nr:chaplin family protein [Streptomyces sp. NBC_01481]